MRGFVRHKERERRPESWARAAVLFVLLTACGLCVAGVGSFDGAADENWGDKPGTHSLIVAEVLRVEPGGLAAGEHRATFRPIATLSGGFDSGRQVTVDLRMSTSQAPGTTSIKQAPAKGALVMAVLFHTGDERSWVVSSGGATFMPTRASAVEVITGLDDPKVRETVRRVQEARSAKRKADPAGK